ncbi:hypothetical protein [Parendozoicomonas haliclonae]|nr:hypothetical protein [Parendozoicomonas haliclonae]
MKRTQIGAQPSPPDNSGHSGPPTPTADTDSDGLTVLVDNFVTTPTSTTPHPLGAVGQSSFKISSLDKVIPFVPSLEFRAERLSKQLDENPILPALESMVFRLRQYEGEVTEPDVETLQAQLMRQQNCFSRGDMDGAIQVVLESIQSGLEESKEHCAAALTHFLSALRLLENLDSYYKSSRLLVRPSKLDWLWYQLQIILGYQDNFALFQSEDVQKSINNGNADLLRLRALASLLLNGEQCVSDYAVLSGITPSPLMIQRQGLFLLLLIRAQMQRFNQAVSTMDIIAAGQRLHVVGLHMGTARNHPDLKGEIGQARVRQLEDLYKEAWSIYSEKAGVSSEAGITMPPVGHQSPYVRPNTPLTGVPSHGSSWSQTTPSYNAVISSPWPTTSTGPHLPQLQPMTGSPLWASPKFPQ